MAPCFTDETFRLLFERSADPIWLVDPQPGVFVDCNQAALTLMQCSTKEQLLGRPPADYAPSTQPDGRPSAERAAALATEAAAKGSLCFEWVARRLDGTALPLEVVVTVIPCGERPLHLVVARDATDRKRMEAELRELNQGLEQRIATRTAELAASEARLRTLLDHAPEAIVVFDGDTGRFVDCNENATRFFGMSREQLLALGPADVSPPCQSDGRPSRDAARDQIERALAGQIPVFEWMHRHADGRMLPCEVRLVQLPAEGRRLLRASLIDNAERRRKERIQQATYQISEAVHTAADLDHLYQRIHSIIQGLMPAENFYIARLDPAREQFSFPYFVDEYDRQPAPMKVTTGLTGFVLRTGKPLLATGDRVVRHQSGGIAAVVDGNRETIYAEVGTPAAVWLGVPLSIQGRPLGVMAVQDYRDPQAYGEEDKQILMFVAEQIALAIEWKRSEQALRESEQKFRALFEASSQGVMLHDEEKYLEVNPATVRILGYRSAVDLIGKTPVDTSPPCQPNGESSAALARQRIAECMAQGSARFDWMSRRADGRDLPLEVILTRVEMGGRRLIQAVINDISERKQAEAELRRALEREKELSALKSNFVSMVSHEFRTPLGIILSSAEILERYFEQLPPAERQEHLESIQRNTRRMAGFMEEVLLLGQVEAGKLDFQPADLDLAVLVRRIIDEVLSATNHRCPVRLSAASVPAPAHGDERLLRHIFTNLLSNAVKYSPEGASVDVAIERDGAEAVCEVTDRGIGIPAEDLDWLYKPFHRGRNVGQLPGTGLGLVIVKRCVELHHGKIHVDTQVGRGTTFRVRLPVFAPDLQGAS